MGGVLPLITVWFPQDPSSIVKGRPRDVIFGRKGLGGQAGSRPGAGASAGSTLVPVALVCIPGVHQGRHGLWLSALFTGSFLVGKLPPMSTGGPEGQIWAGQTDGLGSQAYCSPGP